MEGIPAHNIAIHGGTAEWDLYCILCSLVLGNPVLQVLFDALELANGVHYYDSLEWNIQRLASIVDLGHDIRAFQLLICLGRRRLCGIYSRHTIPSYNNHDGKSSFIFNLAFNLSVFSNLTVILQFIGSLVSSWLGRRVVCHVYNSQ